MPTFDYTCKACGHRGEIMQGMNAETILDCPECGRVQFHREISGGGGIIFRGSGFYETDYKRKRK